MLGTMQNIHGMVSGGFRVSQNELHDLILNSKYLNNNAIAGYSFLKNIFT